MTLDLHNIIFEGFEKRHIEKLRYIYAIKETKSATMNIFRKKKYFLFKSFIKAELS